MLLTIIDVETTGLSSGDDEVIEIAAILFDTASMQIIQQLSTLIKPSVINRAENKNRITEKALEIAEELEVFGNVIIDTIYKLAEISDFVIAHNAKFDKAFLPEIEARWLCTLEDFRFEKASNGSLIQLAADYDVPIVSKHRAMDDARLLVEILKKHSSLELEELISFAAEPNFIVVADCEYEQKDLAKKAGFRWNSIKNRKWAKIIKKSEYQNLVETVAFPVTLESNAA